MVLFDFLIIIICLIVSSFDIRISDLFTQYSIPAPKIFIYFILDTLP